MSDQKPPLSQYVRGLADVARFRPSLSLLIVALGILTAVMGGIGLTFILPIVEIVQADGDPTAQAEGIMLAFVMVYEFLGVPFELEYVVVGVTAVMAARFGSLFLFRWLREILKTNYIRDLRRRGFENALGARVAYYDEKGSDEVLNAIITQTKYAGEVINAAMSVVEKLFLTLVFLGVAFYLAPLLAAFAVVVFGVLTVLVQSGIESGFTVGDRVATANERIQEAVQVGTQGIRDVKMFGMAGEIYAEFAASLDDFVGASISVKRNEALITSLYQFSAATLIFVLIYLALTVGSLSLGSLGVFLFAMFRLGPIVSSLNGLGYKIATDLPHLIRTQEFVAELEAEAEPTSGGKPVPDRVESIRFDGVSFGYGDKRVLHDVSFEVSGGEFVAFVGQSGAGKSTIAALLARLYEPDSGRILLNGTPIERHDVDQWREEVAIVRQNPFIFNETLRYNLTIGNRDATDEEIERACEVAMVTEFIDGLPDGYESMLGDDGVQLSGGQKQRVAIARALLKDAEILVLDEATSDLDTALEERIQRSLEETAREFTTLAIAHRLSTIRGADRIYTVEEGRITEAGDHDRLLEEEGRYADLYRGQVTTD